MLDSVQSLISRFQNSQSETDKKFGTFPGVFTPTVLTILGAIMYLRLGQVVGNAGVGGAILIILLAHVITVSTGLSVSSIATNTRIGAGGAFAIITKSLGIEVGGAIGFPLFLAQGISIALYVLAFGEGWLRIFPSHSYFVVCILAFFFVCLIAYISTSFAFRIQYVILGIVAFSLVSIVLGSFPLGDHEVNPQELVTWGEYELWTFWETFAIFFPAVTGIMAGISMSGSLKDPRKSLPQGTLSAMGITLVIYLALVFWLARYATVDELITNETIMVDKALWGFAILAGILGATFSSALGSIVAAPRVMQALAQNQLLPFSKRLAQETESGEPRFAMVSTAAIGLIALLVALASGGLNAIAAVISMFFIITYGMLNVVVFIELMLNMVSFRPMFKIPKVVPFVGMVGCLFVMFLIDPTFSLIAIFLVIGLYWFLARRRLSGEGSDDVRSGLFFTLANWAANRAEKMPSAPERSWKPTVLMPVRSTGELNGSYRFLWALVAPQGAVNALGIYAPNEKGDLDELEQLADGFARDGIYSQTTLLEDEDFLSGVRAATQVLRRTFFRPNVLFLQLRPDSRLNELKRLIDKTAAYRIGVVLLAKHPTNDLGREQVINIWVSPFGYEELDQQTGQYDLSILLSLQLQRNWDGQINLCMAITEEDDRMDSDSLEAFMADLIANARLPQSSKTVLLHGTLEEGLQTAPRADLSVFGLPRHPSLSYCQSLVKVSDSSCLFVRDSGEESVFV